MSEKVSHEEAERIALAYIDKAFNNPEKPDRRVRHSIPANPREDTDLRLMAYIKQQRETEADTVSRAEHEAALEADTAKREVDEEVINHLQAQLTSQQAEHERVVDALSSQLQGKDDAIADLRTETDRLRAVILNLKVKSPASPSPAVESIEAGRIQTSPFHQVAQASAEGWKLRCPHISSAVPGAQCEKEFQHEGPHRVRAQAPVIVDDEPAQPAPGGTERCPLCLRSYKRTGGLPRDKWADGYDCPCAWHGWPDPTPAEPQGRPEQAVDRVVKLIAEARSYAMHAKAAMVEHQRKLGEASPYVLHQSLALAIEALADAVELERGQP